MAITLNSPISADLMYQFYDNKAITPQIRAALQKRDDAEAAKEAEKSPFGSSSDSKFGPATKVNITDQVIRMNISNNTTKFEKDSEDKKTEDATATTATKKPSRFDVLEYVKNNVAERESAAKSEKDAKLKEIADKIAAEEEAKNKPAETGTPTEEGA